MTDENKDLLENMIPLEDKEIAQRVISKYTTAKDATQTMRNVLWKRFFKMYRQEHENVSAYPYRSKIYVPLVFGQIKTLAPYIMQTIFSSDPAFKLKDCSGMKYDEKIALEKLIETQVHTMELYARLKTFILESLIYGTAIGKVYWERERKEITGTREVKKLKTATIAGLNVPVGFQTVEETYSEYETKFDGPVFANVDLNDFYIDPKADRLKGFWKIHVVEKSYKQLVDGNKKAGGQLYKNLSALKFATTLGVQETEEQRHKDERQRASGTVVDSGSKAPGKIKLLEYWTPDDSEVYTVAVDYGITIRKAKNPFEHGKSPFVFARFQEVPGQFYGMGVPEIVYGLQQNVNTITNQRNDNINLILNRMWKIKKEGGINPATLKSSPGNIIECDEMDEIESFDTPDVTQSAYMEVQHNKNEAQEAIGTKYISGANPTGSNRTATGVRLNQSAEAQIIQGVFRDLEVTCLKPMVDMFYELNHQFNDQETVIQILGHKGKFIDFSIRPEMYGKHRSFYAAGIRNVMEKDVQVHQLTNFLAILGRTPPEEIAAMGVNKKAIYRKVWEAMGLDDADTVLGGAEDAQEQMQQAAQFGMMNQMAQATGAGIGEQLTNPEVGNTLSAGNQAGGVQGTRIQ